MENAGALETKNRASHDAYKDTLPIILGVIPFGLTCGLMGITVGLTPLETILMSALVFAGAAQFMAILLLGSTTATWGIVVFTTLIVNLRHILMSASLAPSMQKLPSSLKLLLSFMLTDESFALTTAYRDQKGYSVNYQLRASAMLYVTWLVSTVAGVLFTNHIEDPLAWGLDFAMPASFIVLLVQRLEDHNSKIIALVATVASVAGALLLPGKWYIIIACLAACTTGMIIEKETK